MPLRKERDFTFRPRSVVDALDGGEVPPGGMQSASNLIFDPDNPSCLECRPAAAAQSGFTGFSGAGVPVVAYQVGDISYGLMPTSRNSGHDEPFAYNVKTGTVLTVSGTISTATTPVTQSTSGDWVPPTMDMVGVLLYVTHPGFPGGVGAFFGWFDLTNPTSPVWHSGNTGGNPLTAVPTSVAHFFNRAWFAVGNAVVYTDTLANNVTNATQVVTIGDNSPVVAQCPVPLGTSVQGILQGLCVFKNTYIAVVTGDDTQGNLTVNTISSEIGTYSPRSIAATDIGIMFAAVDGSRTIKFDGNGNGALQEPNTDLSTPFVFMLNRTRCSAGYNNSIYRISVTNGNKPNQPLEEYWYDLKRKGWTGPHTFVQNFCTAYLDTFVCFRAGSNGAFYLSDVTQSLSSNFVEDSNRLTWNMQVAPMRDDGGAFQGSAVVTVQDLNLPNLGDTYTFVASDVANGVLATATIQDTTASNIWGIMLWGQGMWGAAKYGLDRYNIDWDDSLQFSRLVYQASGNSSLGFKIGKFVVTYQPTGFVKK